MKKLYATLVAICLSLSYVIGYALPNGEQKMMLSQISAIDYIMLIGGGLFLLGMLFILLSMYAGLKKKDEVVYDDIAVDCDTDPEEVEEDNTDTTYEETEEEAEIENEVEHESEEDAEADDIEDIEDIEEAEETCENVEEETDNEEVDEIIEEIEEKIEAVVRLTLTGTNNADVKIAEFTKSAKVGRRGTNDIMISDNAVSGEHCEFIYEDGVVYIRDLKSTNGTLLNDEVIEKKEVKTGDLIIVGKHQYKVNISI